MAKIDGIIGKLFEGGVDVQFQTGAAPMLRRVSGALPMLRQALDSPQIVAAFSEIVPAAKRAQFPLEGTTRWTYAAPAGSVEVEFLRRAERVTALIRRASDAAAPVAEEAPPASAPAPVPTERADGPAMPIPIRGAPRAPLAAEEEADGDELPAVRRGPSLRIIPARAEPPRAIPADAAGAMRALLERMLAIRASDLHLASGTVPMFRVDGEMEADPEWRPLTAERLAAMLWSITPEQNQRDWEKRRDTDFAHETSEGRFRVNLFADRRGIGAVLRHIPNTIRSAEDLGLSKAIMELCSLPKGLVLVTGPTGSGKSTTLAAMIDHINRSRAQHIITIEDPVEFVHQNQRCLVNQREVGVHTASFKQALRAALREDPDVILVGELRDLETISIAIETAETGHLVFGTLHTNTAPSTVDRIIDQFPADRQAQIRTMLSESLKGVVAQTLCKKIGGGRVAAQEVLLVSGAVSNLIREGKTFQLASAMQTGRGAGMATLNDALMDLVKKNLVEPSVALEKAVHRAELRAQLERAGFDLERKRVAAAVAAIA